MPRPTSRRRSGGEPASGTTATAVPAVSPRPVAVPTPGPSVPTGVEGPAGPGGSLGAFGIPRIQREVVEHPERFTIIEVPVGDIVDSPYNPPHRQVLDEEALADILPSVRARGVMSAVLICERDVLIESSPHLDTITDPGRYVMLAGHRRKAASIIAGLTTIPAVVRNEFASARTLVELLLAENGARLQLTPIEEAEAYKRLQEEGMSYAQILESVGGSVRSKGQITKRLKLLDLTESAKEALNQQRISVDGALTLLAKLPDAASQDRALGAFLANPTARTLKAAIEHESRQIDQEAATKAGRATIAEAGLEEINPSDLWGDAAWKHRLNTDEEVEQAREAGDLAGAVVNGSEVHYYREHPAQDAEHVPDGVTVAHDKGQRQAHRDAAAARATACQRMVREYSTVRDSRRPALIDMLSEAVLAGVLTAEAWRRPEVAAWTESDVASQNDLAGLILNDRVEAGQLAFAAVLAAMETEASHDRYAGSRPWPAAVQQYIRRLADLGYHILTPYEKGKLE